MGKIQEMKEKQTENVFGVIQFGLNSILFKSEIGKDQVTGKRVSKMFKGVNTEINKYKTWYYQNKLHSNGKIDADGRVLTSPYINNREYEYGGEKHE